MFNLKELFKNHVQNSRSFAELVPSMCLIAPDVVLNTDGSLMMVFSYEGVDGEGKTQVEIDHPANMFEQAFREVDGRFLIWSYVDRRINDFYPDAEFTNPISKRLDEQWRNSVHRGFTNTHTLVLVMRQSTGAFGYLDVIRNLISQGVPVGKSIVEALRIAIFKDSNALFQDRLLSLQLKEFQAKAQSFEDSIQFLKPSRLQSAGLLQFLHDRINPASEGQPIKLPPVPVYLNTYLLDNTLIRHKTHLEFKNSNSKFISILTVKGWPGVSEPVILDSLLAVPAEFSIVTSFMFSEQEAAESVMRGAQKHFEQASKPIWAYIKEAFMQEESSNINHGKLSLAVDASSAIEEMTARNRKFGYLSYTILVYADSVGKLQESTNLLSKSLREKGYITIHEDHTKTVTCFAASLPGQWAAQLRWWFMSGANLADMLPLRTLSTGSKKNHRISELCARPMPMHALFPTELNTPIYFNFHETDLAHAFVVGPSRKGKTVLMMFLNSQFNKYPDSNVIIIDKDRSARVTTILHGGAYVDVSIDSDNPVQLNPCRDLQDASNRNWLALFVEILIESKGYQCTAADLKNISHAIEQLAERSPNTWRLSNLQMLIPSHDLRSLLDPWVQNGRYARYFDNELDTFDFKSNWTAVEVGKLLVDETLAGAFVEYLFHRIEQRLDGRPTLIYLEECWFLFRSKLFSDRIDNWLRTFAKKEAFLVMTTQGIDEIARSEIFATIIDNVPNRIFLPNENAFAHKEMYRSKFGLNDTQIERIRSATGKQDYYVVNPARSRMLKIKFPVEVLAALRSDSIAQKALDRAMAKSSESDLTRLFNSYIEEMNT